MISGSKRAFFLLVVLAFTHSAPSKAGFFKECKEALVHLWASDGTIGEKVAGRTLLGAGLVAIALPTYFAFNYTLKVLEQNALTRSIEQEDIANYFDRIPQDGERSWARLGPEVYILKSGYVFRLTEGNPPEAFRNTSNVASLQIYKGMLIARRENGMIYMLYREQDQWIDLGNSTKQLLATEDDLIALTKTDELWVYKGQPGPISITYIPQITIMPIGKGQSTVITRFVPHFNGHKVAFSDSGIKGVVAIRLGTNSEGKKDVQVVFKDGSQSWFKDLKNNRK